MSIKHDNPNGPCACGAWHTLSEPVVTEADMTEARLRLLDVGCYASIPATAFYLHVEALAREIARTREARAQVARLREALAELCDLMDDVRSGLYTPDWFTTQSARKALAALPADMAGLVAVPREALYCALQGHVGDCPSLLGAACECGVEAAEDTLRAALGEP